MFTLGRKRKFPRRSNRRGIRKAHIADLPSEVIEKYLLIYLSNDDIRSFSKTGNKRFEKISKTVLDKRGKTKCFKRTSSFKRKMVSCRR